MAKVSIIIPSCAEKPENIQRTLDSIYTNATGDFEIIVGFNGEPFYIPKNIDSRYLGVFLPRNIGIKTNINVLATMAKGKYIYKTDAHCSFGKGFDEILQADMQDNWVVTPRFYVLDGKTWEWQDERFYDYFYLCCPFTDPRGFRFKAGGHWMERTKERDRNTNLQPESIVSDYAFPEIDETPQIHGSGWFVDRDFFLNKIGGYWTKDPFGHAQEGPYLGLKTWLGPWGGKVMVNKKTWYAHMHQDNKDKGFHYTSEEEKHSYDLYARYWMSDSWEERRYSIVDFIKHFMPMPTWPDNWEQLLLDWRKQNGY